MSPEELQKQLFELIIKNTEDPFQGLVVAAAAHMSLVSVILSELKDDEKGAKFLAEHFDILVKNMLRLAEDHKLEADVMGIMLRKVREKAFATSKMDNFQTFVDTLAGTKKPGTKPETSNLDLCIVKDWDFRFPLEATILGKTVTLNRSANNSLVKDSAAQIQLADQFLAEYLAVIKKGETGEFSLTIKEIHEGGNKDA